MAHVVLARSADGSPDLPPVCIGCGRPASRGRNISIPGPSSQLALMAGEHALDNLERIARSPGTIRLPVCWWHRWVVPPSVSAVARADGKIEIMGVSAEFVAAMANGGRQRA